MKPKTHKALSKRVKITKNGKILKRYVGQDHYNGRDRGNTSRNKRRDVTLSTCFEKAVKQLLPHA